MKRFSSIGMLLISLLLFSCVPATITPTETLTRIVAPPATETETSTPHPTTPTHQPEPIPDSFGPDQFPQGYNPLTGQQVADPSLLDLPALLVSISNFPAVARPQAGLSFAPFVYEYYITEGATRFLTVFHGEFPKPELALTGDCEVRTEPITQTNLIVGNHVWHDANRNGIQDPDERGMGGVCVNLLEANNDILQQTTTDKNGYFGFNVEAGKYSVEFVKPAGWEFTQEDIGDEAHDSDADQTSGRTEAFDVSSTVLFQDAGLVPSSNGIPTANPSVKLAAPQVGPVRSGRLMYRFIASYFQNSCLIFASASEEVLPNLPQCEIVMHTFENGGAMINISRLQELAHQSAKKGEFNYANNLYTDESPAGGTPASEISAFWAYLNQSKFVYDAASQAWWRYTDTSEEKKAGILHPDTDRLNGRQLMFENVIILFAEHTVISPTIVDINLALGETGNAYLFRDGQIYPINWSTRAGKYEQTTGLRRPIQFQNSDGTPAALKPGHTWIMVVTPYSTLEQTADTQWKMRFIAPAGAK